MRKMRKGFTLIELLVVISVLGAIAAMMSISSGEALTSAKAGNIVNNLRNFATAANEYYFDNMSKLYASGATIDLAEIKLYMNKGIDATTENPESKLDSYYVIAAGTEGLTKAEDTWYVGYQFPTTGAGLGEVDAVKAKLAGRAKNVGLYGSTGETTAPTIAEGQTDPAVYTSEAVIWMKAREKSRR